MTLRRRALRRLEAAEGQLDRELEKGEWAGLPCGYVHDLMREIAVLRTLLFGDADVKGRRWYW